MKLFDIYIQTKFVYTPKYLFINLEQNHSCKQGFSEGFVSRLRDILVNIIIEHFI